MSIAMSPTPAASGAPASAQTNVLAAAAATASTAKAGGAAAKSPATAATPADNSAADTASAGFQSALQRVLAGATLLDGAPDAMLATTGGPVDVSAETDTDADTAKTSDAAPLADLLLSGMLLAPVTDSATVAAPSTAGAAATGALASAATAPRLPPAAAAALLALVGTGADEAGTTATAAAGPAAPVAPAALPTTLTAGPQAAALASTPFGNRFSQVQPGATDNTPDATAPAAARPQAALAPLAVDAGAAQDRNHNARHAATDLQGLDVTASAGSAADTARRDVAAAGTSASASARAPHPLIEVLGDRIALQLQRGSDRAVIRLDPPMQGQLEITIRHDATGATQVHLSASNSDVVRQLQTLSDSLRQELVHRQAGDVSVVVSHSGRDTDRGQRQQDQAAAQDEPGRGLADTEDAQTSARFALFPT